MEYVTKQYKVCGKQFVVVRKAAHRVKYCNPECLDRTESGVTAI